ncbi:glycosyltransferase [Micromonospora sp. LZ34]
MRARSAVNRLVDSLDRQTLPAVEFEVIFVDDGSPDDTLERLHRITILDIDIDIDTARLGRPLEDTVWDLRTRTSWCGMGRKGALGYTGPARPWLVAGRAAVAYSNTTGGLSVDLAGNLRTFATDAKPHGPAGAVTAFSVPLVNATASGPRRRTGRPGRDPGGC